VTSPFLAPERDRAQRPGRAKASGGAAIYCTPGFMSDGNTTFALTAGTDYYSPLYFASPMMVDTLAFEVTTGVAFNARIGLYAADTDFQPVGAPLVDSGDISVAAGGIKTYTPGSPVYVPRGRVVSVINSSGTPTVREYRGNGIAGSMMDPVTGGLPWSTRWRVTRAYAAFPTPGTAWTTEDNGATAGTSSIVWVRISQP
jgi:hypothetical protein